MVMMINKFTYVYGNFVFIWVHYRLEFCPIDIRSPVSGSSCHTTKALHRFLSRHDFQHRLSCLIRLLFLRKRICTVNKNDNTPANIVEAISNRSNHQRQRWHWNHRVYQGYYRRSVLFLHQVAFRKQHNLLCLFLRTVEQSTL